MDLQTIDGGYGHPPEPEWSLHYSDELDVAAATEEWRTICSYMRDADTLAVANGHAIRRLVEFRIQWRRASEHVAEHGTIIRGKTTGKGGQWNPHWSVMRQADHAIRALEGELGLAPRRRAAAVKAKRRMNRRSAADDYLGPYRTYAAPHHQRQCGSSGCRWWEPPTASTTEVASAPAVTASWAGLPTITSVC